MLCPIAVESARFLASNYSAFFECICGFAKFTASQFFQIFVVATECCCKRAYVPILICCWTFEKNIVAGFQQTFLVSMHNELGFHRCASFRSVLPCHLALNFVSDSALFRPPLRIRTDIGAKKTFLQTTDPQTINDVDALRSSIPPTQRPSHQHQSATQRGDFPHDEHATNPNTCTRMRHMHKQTHTYLAKLH